MGQGNVGMSLGSMLGQFAFGGNDKKAAMKGMLAFGGNDKKAAMKGMLAFGGNDKKAAMKGMLDGAHAGYFDAQSKDSLASALKKEAEANQLRAEQEARNPANLLRNAMTGYGVPTDEAGAVENFIRSGSLGGKYATAADGMGPVEPQPAWMDKLPDVARSLQGVQTALTIGDKNSENIAKAGAINREGRLGDEVIAGRLDPLRLAQAQYASKGSAPFHFSEFGTGNNLTGALDESTGAARNFAGKRQAETQAQQANAVQSYASARNSDASAAKTKQEIAGGGKPPVGYRHKPDGTLEAIPGGPADLKIQGALNQDTQSLNGAISSMDRLAVAANEVLNHPGLAGVYGLRGAIPNVPGTNAADAAALLETLKSQVGFGVLQEMRNNSKTGGALGQVSDKENAMLQQNLAALSKAQSVEQARKSLQKIIEYSDSAKDRLRSAYNMKHGGAAVNVGQPPVDASAGPAGLSPAEQEELAALRKRFGK